MWTNGRFKAVFRRIVEGRRASWEEPNDIPSKGGPAEEVDRPLGRLSSRRSRTTYFSLLRFATTTSTSTDGMQKQPAFFELLKVIFCKIHDERNVPNPLEF